MSNDDIFKALKAPTAFEELDAFATLLGGVIYQLGDLNPQRRSVFDSMARQLNERVKKMREETCGGFAMFSGNGPIARKLRDYVNMETWCKGIAGMDAKRAQIEDEFNFHPTRDEAKLNELREFLHFQRPLMTGLVIEGLEWKPIEEGTDVLNLPSGFYVDRRLKVPLHLLVLSASLADGDLKVVQHLYTNGSSVMYFHHLNENDWRVADGSYTFDALVPNLRAELAAVLHPLGLSVDPVDVGVAIEEIQNVVDKIFADDSISNGQHDIYWTGNGVKELTLDLGGGYTWLFSHQIPKDKDKSPFQNSVLMRKVGSYGHAASFADFNEIARQTILKTVKRKLSSLVATESAQENAQEECECADTVTT